MEIKTTEEIFNYYIPKGRNIDKQLGIKTIQWVKLDDIRSAKNKIIQKYYKSWMEGSPLSPNELGCLLDKELK